MRVGGPDIPVRTQRARTRAHTPGFTLPECDEAAWASGCGQAAAATGADAVMLLAVGGGEDGPAADREARRHGQAMLAALASLQLAQLGGDTRASLTGLASLAAATPLACDPGLQAVLEAIGARAAVELARGT